VNPQRALPLVCYIATIFAANLALDTFGFAAVGLGLMAPAGVFFAGLAFTFRDWTEEALGRKWVLGAIVAGAVCSLLIEDGWRIAVASAVAFSLSELMDMAVYARLRERRPLAALGLSNSVGLVVDSFVFLSIAFGVGDIFGQPFERVVAGLMLGKLQMTVLAVALRALWREARVKEPVPTAEEEEENALP